MSDPKPTFNQAGARVHHAEARTYGHELLAALRKQFPDMDDALWLVKNGASFEVADARGDTALHHAVRMQLRDLTREMLYRAADPDQPNEAGNTVLIIAATGGGEILKLLLDAKPDVNLRNKGGNDALTCAVAAGKADNARLLLDAGARVDDKLLAMAARLSRTALLPMLQEAYDAQTAAFKQAATTAARDIPVPRLSAPKRPGRSSGS